MAKTDLTIEIEKALRYYAPANEKHPRPDQDDEPPRQRGISEENNQEERSEEEMINITAIIITLIICLTALAGGQIVYKTFLVQLEIRNEENRPGPFMRALFGQRPDTEKKEEPKNDE